MKTDDRIARLAEDTGPVPRCAVGRRLSSGIALGVIVSTVIVILWLGLRPDLCAAMHLASYWIKWG